MIQLLNPSNSPGFPSHIEFLYHGGALAQSIFDVADN
jgi:hypothetical protein